MTRIIELQEEENQARIRELLEGAPLGAALDGDEEEASQGGIGAGDVEGKEIRVATAAMDTASAASSAAPAVTSFAKITQVSFANIYYLQAVNFGLSFFLSWSD